MHAVIFVNGIVQSYAPLVAWLDQADLWVAADGGLRHFRAMDRQPHALVGDLDSVEPNLVAELEAAGVHIERHRPEKNETDLELAIEYAIQAGASQIVLLGALGGRLDQTLANLLLLAQRAWPAAISVVEADQVATVLRPGYTLELEGVPGSVVSLIPLTTAVTGITYHGLKYPLRQATLAFGSTRGVSNEMAETRATVQIETGLALIVRALAS
ncbi:MAG: thiamine diphosphokinase [Litorilinea sp.]